MVAPGQVTAAPTFFRLSPSHIVYRQHCRLLCSSCLSPPRACSSMGFVQNLVKRIPSTPSLPSLADLTNEKERIIPRLSFVKRRIRLKGNSKISVPLGAVLLFPIIVIILIIVLIVRHESSPGSLMMPAGAPPAIR